MASIVCVHTVGWAKEKPTSKGVTWANKRAILKIWSLAFLMKPAKCRFYYRNNGMSEIVCRRCFFIANLLFSDDYGDIAVGIGETDGAVGHC